MNENIKTFDDLVFEEHRTAKTAKEVIAKNNDAYTKLLYKDYIDIKQARLDFDNGYGISVLLSKQHYSNGINTYEVAVMHNGIVCTSTPITNDVLGWQIKDEVNEVMKQIQMLQKEDY